MSLSSSGPPERQEPQCRGRKTTPCSPFLPSTPHRPKARRGQPGPAPLDQGGERGGGEGGWEEVWAIHSFPPSARRSPQTLSTLKNWIFLATPPRTDIRPSCQVRTVTAIKGGSAIPRAARFRRKDTQAQLGKSSLTGAPAFSREIPVPALAGGRRSENPNHS